ncbi:MAG: HAMP domain-containing histidine kinase [Polyangiaceae bacterium]|nr:HAMP domain-containing histidine kinase [Polyangiaceae bacterium]
MIADASKLWPRVVVGLVLVSAASAAVDALTPWFLLLRGDVADATVGMLSIGIFVGCGLGLGWAWVRLRHHRFVLRALALGSRASEPYELEALLGEDWRITLGWLVPSAVSVALVCTVWRPQLVDLRTGVSAALLGTIVVAAAALPLQVHLRATLMRAIELAHPELMREVVSPIGAVATARRRIRARLLVAIVTPVAFVALASALVASAHLRRADERQREETARVLARAALEPKPGLVEGAGLDRTLSEARKLGFTAWLQGVPGGYLMHNEPGGMVQLDAPLDEGSAAVMFRGSTIPVLSLGSLLVGLFAIAWAVLLGLLMARSLNRDLAGATRGVEHLDTLSMLRGSTPSLRPARFNAVARLGRAIEQLAGRFQVFAQAQERAINAREAATRMRGLFFASVSHDLKSPLNAILGFTDIIRQSEVITPGQSESLALIESRGRELLALIETILDAARVEAGQLTLVKDSVDPADLFQDAIGKGKDLGGDRKFEVSCDISPNVPALRVDRVRLGRALATFIGHAARTGRTEMVRIRTQLDVGPSVLVQVDTPGGPEETERLAALLSPRRSPGTAEHRGLALALSLARSVVELHGGVLGVESRGEQGACFVVRLPAEVLA